MHAAMGSESFDFPSHHMPRPSQKNQRTLTPLIFLTLTPLNFPRHTLMTRARRPWLFTATLAFGLLAADAAAAQSRWATLDEFLARGIRLNASELGALGRGETIARMLPTTDAQDIAVFGAVQIDVPRAFFVDRQRELPAALRTPTRTQVHLFSDPAAAADVQSLTATNDDLKELRNCRPSDCNFKLPATDMEQFRGTIASAPDAKARVEAYARRRVVEYVTDYRARGNAAMVVFDDRGTVRSSDALAALLRDSSYVFATMPTLGQYLLDYPHATLPGATQVFFWSRDELPHLRPVLRIAHETIYSPPDRSDLTVIATKQIYADHYFEAGLEVIAAVDRPGAGLAGAGLGVGTPSRDSESGLRVGTPSRDSESGLRVGTPSRSDGRAQGHYCHRHKALPLRSPAQRRILEHPRPSREWLT